jgi:hypothetical protein
MNPITCICRICQFCLVTNSGYREAFFSDYISSRVIYPNNLKILVQSCFGKTNTARRSSFLRTGLKALDAALALVALEQPKLPNAALPQAL